MNTNGLFSIINIRQPSITEEFNTCKHKSAFSLVDFVEYVKNNTILTTNIPPNSLKDFGEENRWLSDGYVMKSAYNLLSNITDLENVNIDELKAVSCLFIEQCVLSSNAARCVKTPIDELYTESVIKSRLEVLPTFPIVLSEKCSSVYLDFIDKEVPIWCFDDDNSTLNLVSEWIRYNPDSISDIISHLITKYPASIRNVVYKKWVSGFNNLKSDTDSDKLLNSKFTVNDILYYELSLLKLAFSGVYAELNLYENGE